MGSDVSTRKRNHGGVIRSRFRASAKNAKTSSTGRGTSCSRWRRCTLAAEDRAELEGALRDAAAVVPGGGGRSRTGAVAVDRPERELGDVPRPAEGGDRAGVREAEDLGGNVVDTDHRR